MKSALLAAAALLSLAAVPAAAQNITAPDAVVPEGITVEAVMVHGATLEGNLEGNALEREVMVVLPPSYGEDPTRHYPVVYYLHGFAISGRDFYDYMQVPTAVAENAAAGREFIVVVPDTLTAMGGSMYSNSVTTGNFRDFIATDLVAYIDANYRTIPERASRGLAGHSMGGYGAMRIGMKYSETFSAMYAMSPCCMGANLNPSMEQFVNAVAVTSDEEVAQADFGTSAMLASAAVWSPNPENPPFYIDLPFRDGQLQLDVVARWAANAPLVMVHQYIPQLQSFEQIYVDAGDRDFGIANTVKELQSIFESNGVEHWSEIYEGDHVNRIHERITEHLMPMFSEVLATE